MRNRVLNNPPLRIGVAALCAFATLYAAVGYGWLSGFSAISLLAFVGLGMLYHWALPLLQGREGWFSLGGGAVFALCQAVGEVMEAGSPTRSILFLFVCFLPLYTALVCAALTLLDRRRAKPKLVLAPAGRFRRFFVWLLSGQTRPFLALWGLILLCWLPYYILFFPGFATPDTIHQMNMALTPGTMSSHHPPIHSWWLGGCMRLGQALFGTMGAGVALATATQCLLMALLAAAALRYMARLDIAFGWRVLALCLYTLCPLYGWYSVTLWKDVWLGCFGFLFLLCCVDITRRRAAFFACPGRVALLALSVLGLLISKNNGLYIFAITAVVLAVALKGARRQMAVVLVLGVAASQLITGPLYTALGVQKGSVREALSLPLLQIANVVRVDEESIPPADEALLRQVMPYYDDLPELYNSTVSDSVKDGFVAEAFSEKPGEYLSLYVRLGLAHPLLYVRAALEHTFGYYYCDYPFGWAPLTTYPSFIREYPALFPNIDPMQGQYAEPFANVLTCVQNNIGNERLIPGLSMLFSIGTYYWALLFCGLWAWYKRQYPRLLALVPPLAAWLTCLASPVNGSVRYGFLAVMALPFLLGYMLDNRDSAKGEAPCQNA